MTQCIFVGSRGLISRIPPNTNFRVDGVYFDSHMTFNSHVDKISGNIFNTLLYIKRIKDNFNKNSQITVIQSLVHSIINYGLMVWGTTNTTTMNQIQKMQNFAAKVTLDGASKHEHATPFLRELRWLKMKQKYV